MKSFLISLFVMITAINTRAQESPALNIGDKVPDFKALNDKGETWKLKENLGDAYVVVYFYPAAMTGGCTKQACSFRDDMTEFNKLDAVVVGISGDEVENLGYFRDAHELNFPLLSDPEGKIAKKFGVPTRDGGEITREVNGKEVILKRNVTTSRWTFVIDKKGTLVYKNTSVKPMEDSKQVLEVIRKSASL